jgi:VanZ family protein
LLITVAYAISDEWHQSFVEGRHGSPVDVLIDTAGAGAAALVAARRS